MSVHFKSFFPSVSSTCFVSHTFAMLYYYGHILFSLLPPPPNIYFFHYNTSHNCITVFCYLNIPKTEVNSSLHYLLHRVNTALQLEICPNSQILLTCITANFKKLFDHKKYIYPFLSAQLYTRN